MGDQTLQYYNQNAEQFVAGTLAADMAEIRKRFLDCLPAGALILDFGCGSGRDTKAFLEAGYRVDATDGSQELCERASELTGIHVKRMLFTELDAKNTYDGIWACASILHLNKNDLAAVLRRVERALKPGGVLYTSFKYGTFEGLRNGRYFTYFTEESIREFWTSESSLQIFDMRVSQDVRAGREGEQWINLLARRG